MPNPGEPRPTRQPSRDTRERLVRTAARLFLGRSYQSVGVNEICAATGVQKGSFYHFYPTKADLAVAVIDLHASAMWERLDRHERAAVGPINKILAGGDMVEEVQQGLAKRFGRVVGCPLGNLAIELATTDKVAAERLAQVFAAWQHRIAAHCRDAVAASLLLGGDADLDDLARRIVATLQGMTLLAKAADSTVTVIPEAIRALVEQRLRDAGEHA